MKTDLISTHYANDDARHYTFVRRSGYTSADFRQEWRPRFRDFAWAVVIAVGMLAAFALSALPEGDEQIGHAMFRDAK
jgi:hypothetical protein